MNRGCTRWIKSLWLLRTALGGLVVFLIVGICNGQTADNPFPEALRQQMHLTTEELRAVQRGDSVVKTLPAKDRREIGVYGIVRLQADVATSFKAFKESMAQQKSDRVASGNGFSNSPRAEDVQTLTLSHREIADLQRCTIGACRLKLSAQMIQRFQNEIDWQQPDRDLKTVYLFREILIDYVGRYLEEGDPALIEYQDGRQPVKVADEYKSLFSEFSYLENSAPELVDYLLRYPHQRLEGVKSEIVWTRVGFGLQPVVIVTHQITHNPEPNRIYLVSKQIYANHYFDSSLGLTAVVGGQSGAYLLYVNHSRGAGLDGAFSGLKHGLVEREAVNSLRELLVATQANLQPHPFAESPGHGESARLAQWFLRRAIWWVLLVALIAIGFVVRWWISRRKNPAVSPARALTSPTRDKINSGVWIEVVSYEDLREQKRCR